MSSKIEAHFARNCSSDTRHLLFNVVVPLEKNKKAAYIQYNPQRLDDAFWTDDDISCKMYS